MAQVTQVSPAQAHAALQSGNAVLLDVREEWEYNQVHIAGATLIPLRELRDRLDEVPVDRDVYVYCELGARSARAADFLLGTGRTRVLNIAGGMSAWVDAGLPSETTVPLS